MVTTRICIKEYLREYLIGKYNGGEDGPLRIPPHSELYELLYNLVAKRPEGVMDRGNVELVLRHRRSCKDPRVYNWYSQRHQRLIERKVKMQMRAEFHDYVDWHHHRHGMTYIDAICDFMAKYGIVSISEETLVKDYQRYRERMRPHGKRQYIKTDKNL